MKLSIVDLLFNQKKPIKIEGEVGELIDKVKVLLQELVYNTETNTIEVGGNLEVDGKVQINSGAVLLIGESIRLVQEVPENYSGGVFYLDDNSGIGYEVFVNGEAQEGSYMFIGNEGVIQINDTSKLVDVEGNLILKDLEDAVNGESTVDVEFTEDDWDEEHQAYVKRVELNNCYISVFPLSNPQHANAQYEIYCPYFKGLTSGYYPVNIVGFSGYTSPPETRYITVTNYVCLSVFNGVVTELTLDI